MIKKVSQKNKNLARRYTINLQPNYEKKVFVDGIGWAQHYQKQPKKVFGETFTPRGIKHHDTDTQKRFTKQSTMAHLVPDKSYEKSS